MNILEMKRKDFEKLRRRKWDEKTDDVHSIVILPHRRKHDSGFRCMSFVLCDKNNEPMCICGGGSDVLFAHSLAGSLHGFSVDCLPESGLLRVFLHGHTFMADSALSTFMCEIK